MPKLFPGHFKSDSKNLNSSYVPESDSINLNSSYVPESDFREKAVLFWEQKKKKIPTYSGVGVSSGGTCAKLKMMSRRCNQKIPSKEEWLSFWYKDGNPDWTVVTKDEERVVYTINVYAYYTEGGNGGCGVILRDDFGRPLVASSLSSHHGPVSFLYHELQGVRGGLQHVLDFKLVAYYIELLCQSETTVAVLRLIRWKADDIVHDTPNSPDVWEDLKRCFDFDHVEFLEVFRPLITEISKLYVKLPDTDITVITVDEDMNKAAEYMAIMHRKMTHKKCEVVMKHGGFPVILQDILYKDAYEGTMYYSRRTIWDAKYLNPRWRKLRQRLSVMRIAWEFPVVLQGVLYHGAYESCIVITS